LLVDQHKAVRAMVGVRMVWVSPEQRRKGLATKLLDAAR
jgi:predicted GNAT family acetyltransferase